MSQAPALNDQDYVFAYVTEYLDDELDDVGRKRLEKYIASHESQKDLIDRFQSYRGKLQIAFQDFQLDENQILQLRRKVRSANADQQEAEETEKLSQYALFVKFLRSSIILLIIGACLWGAKQILTPVTPQKFDAIGYLGYEAMAIERDPSRIDYPAENINEIRQFFSFDKGLGFVPTIPENIVNGWTATGASVIDYEVTKVSLIEFEQPESKEKLYYFSYKGSVNEVKDKGPAGKLTSGSSYFAYTSDQMNLVLWQETEELVGVIATRRSAPEAAAFIR